MLFDLQSPGRRRVIKVVYSILALLLAVGLVGFGIGSDATGGISEIFTGNSSTDTGFEDEIEDRENDAEENPRDPRAQLELVTLYIQDGNAKLEQDEQTLQPVLTSEAEESYTKAADAFAAYLKLKPKQPDTGAALQMANTFFVLAQNQTSAADARAEVENAAEAQRVAADQDPSAGNLGNLALYLYFAGDFAAADGAAAQSVAKAPANSRAQNRKQLEQIKQQAEAFQKQVKQEQKQGAQGQGQNPLDDSGGALGGGAGLGGGTLGAP